MLAQHVLYRKYADYLYIINLNTAKSYVFEGIASDLMDFLADVEIVNLDEIIAHVNAEYEIENPDQMREDVTDFVHSLQTEGILIEGKHHD